jgi:hypothetical protein
MAAPITDAAMIRDSGSLPDIIPAAMGAIIGSIV